MQELYAILPLGVNLPNKEGITKLSKLVLKCKFITRDADCLVKRYPVHSICYA